MRLSTAAYMLVSLRGHGRRMASAFPLTPNVASGSPPRGASSTVTRTSSTTTTTTTSRTTTPVNGISRVLQGDAKIEEEQRRLFPEELNVIYDSKCNVCKLETDFLRQRDLRLNGSTTPKLRFTDLEGGIYNELDPKNGGISYSVGMSSMHAVTPSGQTLKGVRVFEKAYQQVQLGWLFRITHFPGFKQLANFLYDIFAAYRTLLTRGSTVDKLVEAYEAKKQMETQQKVAAANCEDDRCTRPK